MTEHYVRPDVRGFLDFAYAQPGPRTHEVTPPEARQMMKTLVALADQPAGDIAVVRDLSIPGPAGAIPARLFDCRAHREPGPVVLFIHGGGFVIGDVDVYTPLAAEIARGLDLPVLSVEYRLAPEHPFPAAPEDCEAAARWVASNPAELGRHPTSLVVAGDSAGGNLTIVTSMALRDRPAAVPVIAQWPIYPVTDGAQTHESVQNFRTGYLLEGDTMEWFARHYAADPADWRLNPILKDQAGMPPTLVLTASLDPLLDQGRDYAARLIRAGVPTIYREAKGTIHGFLNLRRAIPSGQGDLAGCLAVLKPLVQEAEAGRVMTEAAAGAARAA